MVTQPAPAALNGDTVNPRLKEAQYAVRGDIVARAGEIKQDLAAGKGSYPFKSVVSCNIGNPQALGQKPITFYRQVLCLCEYPQLLEQPGVDKMFPSDVIARAKEYLKGAAPGGTGAYTDSAGLQLCREQIAKGIEERDGFPCDPKDIIMTTGASGGVVFILQLLIRNKQDAVLIPYPQYPLYSAAITLCGGTVLPYYPDEDKEWAIDLQHLESTMQDAKQRGIVPRCLAVITPGNPTGQVIERDNQVELIKFAKKHDLLICADEVYQVNIYDDAKKFVSFKKTIREMGDEYNSVTLISLQSISKGFYGECGRRGGYMEVIGMDKAARAELTKATSINLCPSVNGQICTAMVMWPPKEGEPSYELYKKERDGLLSSLKRRAKMLEHALNELEGVSCTKVDGALYAFPTITLPKKAADKAREMGKSPDWLYCKEMLESTGIVVVPGSGFGQAEGTWHFRTTILPAEDEIQAVCDSMKAFHGKFLKQYADEQASGAKQQAPKEADTSRAQQQGSFVSPAFA